MELLPDVLGVSSHPQSNLSRGMASASRSLQLLKASLDRRRVQKIRGRC
jgi:hypothetical protein